MTTATDVLAVLSVEAHQSEHLDPDEGQTPRVDYRPVGVVLLNDGVFRHWMAPGETYRIFADDAGWRVTCQTWSGDHTYRLYDEATGVFLSSLPTEDGRVELERGTEYELAECRPYGPWTLRVAPARRPA